MRWIKRIALGLAALILLLCVVIAGLFVVLNSETGRNFAVRQINKYGASYVQLDGLGGHFPADLKIPSFRLVDPQGTWLSGKNVELKWSPLQLLHKNISVQALTAASIDVARSPTYPAGKGQSSESGNSNLPNFRVNLDRLEIGTLSIAPALAGEAVALHVAGETHLKDFEHGDITLNATTPDGAAQYQIAGNLDPDIVGLKLHVHEPPNGLIGHYSGPQAQLPLSMDVALNGPRAHAALQAALALGDAKLNLAGTLGLDQSNPFADVTLSVPALAPFGVLAKQSLAGDTSLHLVVVQTAKKDGATLVLKGRVALTQAPAGLDKFLNGETNLSVLASLQGRDVSIGQLALDGPHFNVNANGTLNEKQIDLFTDAALPDIAALAPQLAGGLELRSHVTGSPQDFAADADIDGNVSVPSVPSGPFTIALRAQHLPQTPQGTLKGSGTLAGAPLALDAAFARAKDGAASVKISQAQWKSLNAQADLALAAGAKLPNGTAQLQIGALSDFDVFTGTKMLGAVQGRFAYSNEQILNLDVTAKNVVAVANVGAANAEVKAEGKLDALAVQINAAIAAIMSAPAKLDLAGVLNVPEQSVHLSSLTGNWKNIAAKLRGPADIETKPDIAVRHLDLALGSAGITLDGTISPELNAKANVKNLDLTMVKNFVPSIDAGGLVNLTADLTGTVKAPLGKITLDASGLQDKSGPAAGLPAASIKGQADLKGDNALINLAAQAGQDLNLAAKGTAPLGMTGPMNLAVDGRVNLAMLNPLLKKQNVTAAGIVTTNAQLSGTPKAPVGDITLNAIGLQDKSGPAASLPPAAINANINLKGQSALVNIGVNAGSDVNLTARGTAPLSMTGPLNMALNGRLDLKLLDPLLTVNGTLARGVITTDMQISGTPSAPNPNGTLRLANGSVQNISSGLNLTAISADIAAAGKQVSLNSLTAKAGQGTINGHGTINLGNPALPVNFALNADNATPIASDLITETLNANLTLQGEIKGASTLAGKVDLLKANINIPKSLPASVANLPIYNASAPPPPPATPAPPAPPINLSLDIRAQNQIFIRGDGLFAELGGHIKVSGTAANPQLAGGFKLIRGNFSLAGKVLQFTSGQIDFNGGGMIPALDLEASTTTSNNGTATLVVGGTAAKPKISLTSSPPLPSDEVLAQLLFAQSSTNLTPFQAATLAAALAQIAGIGGGGNPLDSVRNALGLDQLSVGSSASGSPTLNAGRYVAPGVYVGASQSASGQGTSANVEINLYKGLKLQTSTGTDSTGQNDSSVGLIYQFNY